MKTEERRIGLDTLAFIDPNDIGQFVQSVNGISVNDILTKEIAPLLKLRTSSGYSLTRSDFEKEPPPWLLVFDERKDQVNLFFLNTVRLSNNRYYTYDFLFNILCVNTKGGVILKEARDTFSFLTA